MSGSTVATPGLDGSLDTFANDINTRFDELTVGTLPGASDINAGWMLTSAYLIFFMQAGFAMLCAGAVRAKNAKNIILLNILDACLGSIMWYCLGFAFAYGDPDSTGVDPVTGLETFPYKTPFIGHRFFFQNQLPRTAYVTWFFQFTFAATGATIVSGAVAERCRFEAYLMYNALIVAFVYPVVAHWVWSPFGWLSALRDQSTATGGYVLFSGSGVYDFAGDGPVHMVGGLASLAAAWVLGPRIGRYDADGKAVDMPGHNASLTLLGVFLLWFGWYGFNPGSTAAIVGDAEGFSKISAAVAINTTIGAATGCLSTLFIIMIHEYRTLGVVTWDLLMAGNGALAGLVAITGAAAFVQTWSTIIIGIIGGLVFIIASKVNLHVLKVDDPLDAIAVHAGAGIWGLLAGAAFADKGMVTDFYGPMPGTEDQQRPYGFIMGDRGGQLLGAHVVYIICITAWTLGIMTPFFLLIKKLGVFRVSPEVEAAGLDISHHGGSAYPHERPAGKPLSETGYTHMSTSDYPVSAEMVRRLINENNEKLKKQLSGGGDNGTATTPLTAEKVV